MLDPLCDCQPNTSNLVAIKTMKKRLGLLSDYTRVKEVKFILSIPSHPCLVQIYEMFIDDVNFQLHITMEPMSQNLYQLMKARKASHFSQITLKSILLQILCAIRHIHRYNYFHRDVKPENILVVPTQHYYGSKDLIPPSRKSDNFVIKLADYGLARHIHNLKPYTAYVSTRWYRLPEILLRQRWYSRPIDVWAFGAVAAEVANFMPLFPGSNELDQIWRILKAMGSPTQNNMTDSDTVASNSSLPLRKHAPLGGYWNEAQTLASKLGFVLPAEPGLKITEILTNPQHTELGAVVQACLTWDPQLRPTVDYICSMPYFQNSPAAADYTEPARYSIPPPQLERESVNPISCYDRFHGFSSPQHPTPVAHLVHSDCNNVHAASNTFEYDDDDGYEREFMKENSLASPILEGSEVPRNLAHSIGDPVRMIKESMGALPRAGVYQKVTSIISMYQARNRHEMEPISKETRLSIKRGYVSDTNPPTIMSGNTEESTDGGDDEEYSWNPRKEPSRAIPAIAPETQRVGEAIDEEYSLVGDVSFGSGQEINVN